MRAPIVLALLLATTPATAQKVYKCTAANGTTEFSQRPCSDDPDKVQTVDTSRSLKTGSGGSVADQSDFASMNEVRRRCQVRLDNISSRYAGQRRRIADEIAALESRVARTNNNLAGATLESGLRQQIAGLAAERGSLSTAESQEMQAAREQCAAEELAEQERIDRDKAAREEKAKPAAPKAPEPDNPEKL
ncbi:MAG: DUF4124 domain-containing protein [Candidatus Accumulibacter sp.]|nr:DUF4124 domain-containing protein [Accumulibacter sp.]